MNLLVFIAPDSSPGRLINFVEFVLNLLQEEPFFSSFCSTKVLFVKPGVYVYVPEASRLLRSSALTLFMCALCPSLFPFRNMGVNNYSLLQRLDCLICMELVFVLMGWLMIRQPFFTRESIKRKEITRLHFRPDRLTRQSQSLSFVRNHDPVWFSSTRLL